MSPAASSPSVVRLICPWLVPPTSCTVRRMLRATQPPPRAQSMSWVRQRAQGILVVAVREVDVSDCGAGCADTTGPVVSLIGNSTTWFEATASTTAYVDAGASALDSIEGAKTPSVTSNTVNSHVVGVYNVTWTASDSAGNTGSVMRVVQVIDTTPPTITLSDDSTVVLEAVADAGYVEAAVPQTTDAAAGTVDVVFTTNVEPALSNVGSFWSKWTATDAAGNSRSVSRTITVRDTTPPVITVHQSTIAVALNPSSSAVAVTAAVATAADTVDGAVTITGKVCSCSYRVVPSCGVSQTPLGGGLRSRMWIAPLSARTPWTFLLLMLQATLPPTPSRCKSRSRWL